MALTSRHLIEFAREREYPLLCVRGGAVTRQTVEGSIVHLELARGPLAFSLDKGLRHDPFLWRHQPGVAEALDTFKPDVIHVVSPGDVSEIGVFVAKRYKVPLAISWHTNLHEFGAMRLFRLLDWLGDDPRKSAAAFREAKILSAMIAFYRLGDVLFAPNGELVDMLRERTRKPVFLMKRGIDTRLFSPEKRTVTDGLLRLGYVGRITPEKNVRFLRDLEQGLGAMDTPSFRFLVVGDGSEKEWLSRNLFAVDLPGILSGEALAEAYANMDVFIFPSRTDTFGNVVLEAFASGRPAVVTAMGGPKFIVRDGLSGFIAEQDSDFIARTATLICNESVRLTMGNAARLQACGESWESVFDRVYDGYRVAIQQRQ